MTGEVCVYRERHDSSACRGHEGLRDLEQPPAASTQLLPLLAPKLAVEALRYVARQLDVLLLVRACNKRLILVSAWLIPVSKRLILASAWLIRKASGLLCTRLLFRACAWLISIADVPGS